MAQSSTTNLDRALCTEVQERSGASARRKKSTPGHNRGPTREPGREDAGGRLDAPSSTTAIEWWRDLVTASMGGLVDLVGGLAARQRVVGHVRVRGAERVSPRIACRPAPHRHDPAVIPAMLSASSTTTGFPVKRSAGILRSAQTLFVISKLACYLRQVHQGLGDRDSAPRPWVT